MKVAVVSIGSFDTQYSDYHIMRDIILGLLERGHEVNLIQKQYFDTPQYPQQFEKYLKGQLQVQNIRFEKKAKADLKARYLADLSYYKQACTLMKKDKHIPKLRFFWWMMDLRIAVLCFVKNGEKEILVLRCFIKRTVDYLMHEIMELSTRKENMFLLWIQMIMYQLIISSTYMV